ncbi:MAG: response regulator [Deltaproteobacteria bacterium]|nr:response regulator [Deltaproteobacteria bacterium]
MHKILLVDDDPDFVAATKMVLESRHDYKVLTAGDGVFGLATARAERPGLIILDVLMPFEDGFDTARELKTDPELSQIPIMMLTSFSQRKGETDIAVTQGMELEAEDYVEKPVSPQELLRRVDKLLKEKR